jgi:hypothetical protein
VLVTVASALAGCGSSDGAAAAAKAIPLRSTGSTSSTSAAPSTTSTTVVVATTTTTPPHLLGVDPALMHVVWDDYEAAMDAAERASAAGDPDDPALQRHFTGAALESVADLADGHRVRGEAVHFPDGSHHGERLVAMARLDASRIDLTTCVLDDAIVTALATGEVVNDRVTLAHGLELMVLEHGNWKLAHRDLRPTREGECPGM